VFEIELGTNIAYGLRVDWQKGGAPSSANVFSLIDVSQATPGHVVQVDVRLPGSKDSISKVRATTSTGAYMVRLSGNVPRSRTYGGKMWQVSSFNLDNRDYAEIEEGGSMAVFLSDSTNYSAYLSGSEFEAAELAKYYSAGGLNLVSPFVRGSFYLVLSGEMSARNSATPDLRLELYRDPSSVIREELPALSGNSLRIAEVANRFPIDIEFAINSTGHAEVLVHDALGGPVGTLASGSFTADKHHLSWRGDENGPLANGVYVVTLRTGEGLVSRKVVVVR
jgi:hypothetical protein